MVDSSHKELGGDETLHPPLRDSLGLWHTAEVVMVGKITSNQFMMLEIKPRVNILLWSYMLSILA